MFLFEVLFQQIPQNLFWSQNVQHPQSHGGSFWVQASKGLKDIVNFEKFPVLLIKSFLPWKTSDLKNERCGSEQLQVWNTWLLFKSWNHFVKRQFLQVIKLIIYISLVHFSSFCWTWRAEKLFTVFCWTDESTCSGFTLQQDVQGVFQNKSWSDFCLSEEKNKTDLF